MIDLRLATDFMLCLEHLVAKDNDVADKTAMVNFLRDHERRPVVLRKISGELHRYHKRFPNLADNAMRRRIIAATSQLFYNLAKKHKTEQNLSEATKAISRKKSLHEDVNEIVREVDGSSTKKII